MSDKNNGAESHRSHKSKSSFVRSESMPLSQQVAKCSYYDIETPLDYKTALKTTG